MATQAENFSVIPKCCAAFRADTEWWWTTMFEMTYGVRRHLVLGPVINLSFSSNCTVYRPDNTINTSTRFWRVTLRPHGVQALLVVCIVYITEIHCCWRTKCYFYLSPTIAFITATNNQFILMSLFSMYCMYGSWLFIVSVRQCNSARSV